MSADEAVRRLRGLINIGMNRLTLMDPDDPDPVLAARRARINAEVEALRAELAVHVRDTLDFGDPRTSDS